MAELDLNMLSTSDLGYTVDDEDDDDPVLLDQDGNPVETWRERYPYDERMPRSQYEREKRLLQIQLLKLQRWTKRTGARHAILFEGRDAAGKGGTIKRFMEHLNPRGARNLLSKFDYDNKDYKLVGEPDPLIVGRALED